jgi:hypothetical protein
MCLATLLDALTDIVLSDRTKVLNDPSNGEFRELLSRWTDIDKKQPGAIICPATEEDIVKIVGTTTINGKDG